MNKRIGISIVITLLFASLFVSSTWGAGRVARQVVDINQRSGDSYPRRVAQLPNAILFVADDGDSGTRNFYERKRLWRSDGTAAGTYKLGDMIPSYYDNHYIDHEGAIYFPARVDGINQLWRTDGTQAGTYQVMSFGTYPDTSIFLRDMGNKLVVEAYDRYRTPRDHLYLISGGTKTLFFAGETREVHPFNNSMLIETFNPQAVYVSDGTAAGTQQIASSAFDYLWTTDTHAYFVVNGTDLYVTDGTAAGTQLLSTNGSRIDFLVVVDDHSGLNDGVQFVWGGDTFGRFFFRTDGTPAGTYSLMPLTIDQSVDRKMFQINGLRYFMINQSRNYGDDNEASLWVTDGTVAGTQPILDPLSSDTGVGYYGQANNNVALLAGYDQLWRTSGTADSTNFLLEGRTLTGANPFEWGGNLYFFTAPTDYTSNQRFLQRTNGYTITEFEMPSLDFYEYGTVSFYQQDNIVYIVAERLEQDNPDQRWALWKIDLNDGTSLKLADDVKYTYGFDPQFNDNLHVTAYAGGQPIYMFVNVEGEMWRTDGTPTGTYQFAQTDREESVENPLGFLGQVNGRWLFAGDDGATGVELYATVDGSPATTGLVNDINAFSAASNPSNLYKVGNRTCYAASDGGSEGLYCTNGGTTELIDSRAVTGNYYTPLNAGVINNQLYYVVLTENGQQLWRTNGTKAGTVYTGVDDPVHFFPLTSATTTNGIHFYVRATTLEAGAKSSIIQYDLWRTDGTPSGTYQVQMLSIGDWFDAPHQLTAVNNQLYFFNLTPNLGMELWKTDGWNTGLVKDIAPGNASSKPAYTTLEMVAVNGGLYFWADDGVHGRELWRSNGTAAGTVLVKDIQPGSNSSWLKNLTAVNNRLFFTPATQQGYELWTSYGTANGTYMVKDINAPWGSSNPSFLTPYHGNVVFAADDGVNGTELWRSDGTPNGTIRLTDFPDGRTITDIATTWDTVYVILDDGTVWYNNGYGMGEMQVMSENGRPFKHSTYADGVILPVNNDLYIVGSDGGGNELWRISP